MNFNCASFFNDVSYTMHLDNFSYDKIYCQKNPQTPREKEMTATRGQLVFSSRGVCVSLVAHPVDRVGKRDPRGVRSRVLWIKSTEGLVNLEKNYRFGAKKDTVLHDG